MAASKPFIIPIFIPHSGCPHRCAFCNQNAVTGSGTRLPSARSIREEIEKFLGYRRGDQRTEISFYGGNFLGLDRITTEILLETAAAMVAEGKADGIRFSTRPDTIDQKRLASISGYPVSTVEIGAQSMDDSVLERCGRGHTAADTVRAVKMLKDCGYRVGVQIMIGLPGGGENESTATGQAVAGLCPHFVRIYPTLVIRGSRLAAWFAAGMYRPLDMPECIGQVKDLYLLFTRRSIRVIRMGLQANEGFDTGEDLIAGPYHPAFGEMVISEIMFDTAFALLSTGPEPSGSIRLAVNRRRVSAMRGLKNFNIHRLRKCFAFIRKIDVIPDPEVKDLELKIR